MERRLRRKYRFIWEPTKRELELLLMRSKFECELRHWDFWVGELHTSLNGVSIAWTVDVKVLVAEEYAAAYEQRQVEIEDALLEKLNGRVIDQARQGLAHEVASRRDLMAERKRLVVQPFAIEQMTVAVG